MRGKMHISKSAHSILPLLLGSPYTYSLGEPSLPPATRFAWNGVYGVVNIYGVFPPPQQPLSEHQLNDDTVTYIVQAFLDWHANFPYHGTEAVLQPAERRRPQV